MSVLKSCRLPWRLLRNYSTITSPSSSTIINQQEVKGLWTRRIQKDPELTINKMLQNNENPNDPKKWIKIRNELLSSNFKLSEINVDAVIIDTCNDFNNKSAALSYTNFLLKNNYELNMAITGKYFRLLSALDRELTDDENERIKKMYDDMRKKYPLLDSASAESAVLALSRTNRWRECIELIDMINITGHPKTTVLSSVSSAAFDNNDEELGWKCLVDILPRLWPTEKPYQSYLSFCKRSSNSPEILEKKIIKMFEFWKEHGIHPWVEVLHEYADALTSTGWRGRSTTVKLTGMCCNCKQTLEALKLTPDDFKRLSEIVLNNVLVGDNIYCKTTPQELNKFKRFIDETSPYDIVVDGLNAAYTLRNSRDHVSLGNELANVVRAFKNQHKKVLVLGRHHMGKWKGPGMDYVRANAHMFLADNLSEDDPYLLYATLKSGLNTYFSSKDLMRQHKYLFKDANALKLFRMWQMTRQVMPRYVGDRKKNTLVLIYPPSYVPIAQSGHDKWHLPCTRDNVYGTPTNHDNEPPKLWYCLQKTVNK